MSKEKHLEMLKDTGIIAVLRRVPKDQLFQVVDALVESGVNVLELTVDSDDAFSSIRELNDYYGDRALVGAGTVVTPGEARQALDAGSQFIFSPSFDEEVVQLTHDAGVISIPGVLTPTEMVKAYQEGADAVKIFPASAVGPRYLKDLKGPLGHIPMIPTGGINVDNTAEFIKYGAIAVGVGGSLVDPSLDLNTLKAKATAFVDQVKQGRGEWS
ncbi:bifunctional 4-hydroxy-2-oxoglutarate aldolase/2-dehydro-3-deoxy-phosphogluconate aldolase [Alkalibacillus sp. S2W]|uniref:bifunctional 4-hydroxy-2-oxoglutarate aldolase/2-dehydro-3-deoxy-phosphogluconate aldolase n=1 Tax=Alkalibacillus sp. S2W TaxID=3386553 RepID=UPI00398CB165